MLCPCVLRETPVAIRQIGNQDSTFDLTNRDPISSTTWYAPGTFIVVSFENDKTFIRTGSSC